MRGITLIDIAPELGLTVLFGAVVFLVLWLRSRRIVVDYRHILDQQDEAIMRIDIDRLEPRLCNRSFSKVMGYTNNLDCVSLFNENPHLPQQNFYQIYRLSLEGRPPNIVLHDCSGNGIKHSVSVRVNQDNQSMDLVLHPIDKTFHPVTDQSAPDKGVSVPSAYQPEPKEPRSLFELLNPELGVWEIDLSTGSYIHNDKWVQHLGYQNEVDIEQINFWNEVTSPSDKSQLIESINSAEGELPFDVSYRLADRFGVERNIETIGLVVSRQADGSPQIIRGTHRDVTFSESGIRQANSDTDQINAKDKHDLMNQLATIQGYSELIAETENLPEGVGKFLQEILSSAKNAERTISSERLGAGEVSLWLQTIASENSLKITGRQLLPFTLESDTVRSAIHDVVEFMESEGCSGSQREIQISNNIESPCSACSTNPVDEFSSITISTPDIKFSQSQFKHILDLGFSTTQLGATNHLLCASELMHKNGGHIHIAKEGGTFLVSLLVPSFDRQMMAEGIDRSSTGKILIVDDDPSVANYLKEVVQRAGFLAQTYNDAELAMKEFKENPAKFDLVITDQSMPGLSGEVLMQSMRQLRPGLPIIVCTGHSEIENADAALKLGAVAFITKPVNVSQLLKTIRENLGLIKV